MRRIRDIVRSFLELLWLIVGLILGLILGLLAVSLVFAGLLLLDLLRIPVGLPATVRRQLARLVPGPAEPETGAPAKNWSDLEIDTRGKDRFSSQDYADVLAERAAKADTPITIGIFGPWGSGKTSLMRLTRAALPGQREPDGRLKRVWTRLTGAAALPRQTGRRVLLKRAGVRWATAALPGDRGRVDWLKRAWARLIKAARSWQRGRHGRLASIWVNVWQLSNQEEVWHAFLQAVFGQVHHGLPLWRRIDARKVARALFVNSYRVVIVITPVLLGQFIENPEASWTDVLRLLRDPFAESLVQGGGTLLTYGLAVWTLIKPAVEAARGVVNLDLEQLLQYGPYEAQVSELQQLQGRFEQLVRVLVGEAGRLVVFIDDLDRCTPEKIPEVLEAIKLFTTTPRCVYVIGLDHEIVRRGIQTRYEFGPEAAAEYLEKIVQIPFHLPPLDEGRMESFIHADYADLQTSAPTAADVFAAGLEPNPRKVKRALNIYRTLLELAEVRVKNWEMDPVDPQLVAKMVVIESRFRRLHGYLVREPEFLLRLEQLALTDKGLNEDGLAEDKPVGAVLLGTRAPEGAPAKPGLVEAGGLRALNAVLGVKGKHFNDPDQKGQVRSYIYLIATTEGTAEGVRPTRHERIALLGGKSEEIRKQVDEILVRGADDKARQEVVQTYIKRLNGVLSDVDRYTSPERVSANMALDLLEGWKRQEDWEPLTLRVPAGAFVMGSTDDDAYAASDEKPQHSVSLPAYRIGRYPVTNAEFAHFIADGGYAARDHWTEAGWRERERRGWTEPEGYGTPFNLPDHPVVGVSWYEALAYCRWLEAKSGRPYRLPSEAEWEQAARGSDGRIYPWGNVEPTRELCNFDNNVRATTPVDRYSPRGDSPYGCADMAGNVWEWCATRWQDSYRDYQDDNDPAGEARRVVRGGSWFDSRNGVRCAFRDDRYPDYRLNGRGFRVVVSSPSALDSEPAAR